MIKHFCDACGKEVSRNTVSDRLKGARNIGGKRIEFEVTVGVNGTWNSGDLCKPCLLGLIEGEVARV